MTESFDRTVHEVLADGSIRRNTLKAHLCDHWAFLILPLNNKNPIAARERRIQKKTLEKANEERIRLWQKKRFRNAGPVAFDSLKEAKDWIKENKHLPCSKRRIIYEETDDGEKKVKNILPIE